MNEIVVKVTGTGMRRFIITSSGRDPRTWPEAGPITYALGVQYPDGTLSLHRTTDAFERMPMVFRTMDWMPGALITARVSDEGILTMEITARRNMEEHERAALVELSQRWPDKPASKTYQIWESALARPITYKGRLEINLSSTMITLEPAGARPFGDDQELMREAFAIEGGEIEITSQEDYEFHSARLAQIKAELKQRKEERAGA